MNEKTLKEMNDAEFDEVINGLKFAAFIKWLKEGKEKGKEARELSNEIERRTGLKRGSRENFMCMAFFAGMDAGVEMLEAAEAETENEP